METWAIYLPGRKKKNLLTFDFPPLLFSTLKIEKEKEKNRKRKEETSSNFSSKISIPDCSPSQG